MLTVAGTYIVKGTSVATGCTVTMTGSASVSVTAAVAVSVGITINPNDTVCSGTSVTFTAVPVNGGLTPGYAWEVNSFPVSISTSSYTFIPANGDRSYRKNGQ